MAKFAEVIQCLRHGGTAARQAWDVLGNKEVMMQIPQRIAKDIVPKMYNNHYGNAQRKLSENHTNHPNLSKPVFQKDKDGCLVNMFPSAAEASRQTGIPQSAIVRCCNGEKYYKSAGGYLWEYIPE